MSLNTTFVIFILTNHFRWNLAYFIANLTSLIRMGVVPIERTVPKLSRCIGLRKTLSEPNFHVGPFPSHPRPRTPPRNPPFPSWRSSPSPLLFDHTTFSQPFDFLTTVFIAGISHPGDSRAPLEPPSTPFPPRPSALIGLFSLGVTPCRASEGETRQLSRHPCIPPISVAGFKHPTNQRTAREVVVASLPTRLSTGTHHHGRQSNINFTINGESPYYCFARNEL